MIQYSLGRYPENDFYCKLLLIQAPDEYPNDFRFPKVAVGKHSTYRQFKTRILPMDVFFNQEKEAHGTPLYLLWWVFLNIEANFIKNKAFLVFLLRKLHRENVPF